MATSLISETIFHLTLNLASRFSWHSFVLPTGFTAYIKINEARTCVN